MKKNLLQRFIIIVVVTLLALWVVLGPRHRPSLSDFTLAGINKTLRDNIRLGLDLKGGSHLVMRVQVEEYLKRITEENVAIGVRETAKAAGYNVKDVRGEVSGDTYRVILEAEDASKIEEMRTELPKRVNDFGTDVWTSRVEGNRIVWEMREEAKNALSRRAVEDAIRIIDTRINAVGVAEPTLQEHGAENSRQILLQMPGIQDPERIKALIVGESRLELMKVISPPNPSPIATYPTEQAAIQSLGGQLPPNRRVLPYDDRDEPANAAGQQPQPTPGTPSSWVVVESPSVVSGSELRSAEAYSQSGADDDYEINFTLKPGGAQKFGSWTGANINQYMAVVLNDRVKSAPFIKGQITDQGQITGNFTKESANDLALTLRSGALPARLTYIEERTVGPSLGEDSIRAGVTASLIGLILIMAFMIFYYRGSGLNAVVALLLNVILTLAALIIFDATLTLPGIAGVILSLGMAVDSNVLIFERIREELRTGKTVSSSVAAGFDRAFTTIIDTHVTTIVAALFLFVFGTGPIRGFAVTLVLSLIANLFSAVYVSRTIFIWLLSRKRTRAESLSI